MVDLHAQEIDIELFRVDEVFDVKDDVIDAGDFKRCLHSSPPEFQLAFHYCPVNFGIKTVGYQN